MRASPRAATRAASCPIWMRSTVDPSAWRAASVVAGPAAWAAAGAAAAGAMAAAAGGRGPCCWCGCWCAPPVAAAAPSDAAGGGGARRAEGRAGRRGAAARSAARGGARAGPATGRGARGPAPAGRSGEPGSMLRAPRATPRAPRWAAQPRPRPRPGLRARRPAYLAARRPASGGPAAWSVRLQEVMRGRGAAAAAGCSRGHTARERGVVGSWGWGGRGCPGPIVVVRCF
jgi:hypothetical protein